MNAPVVAVPATNLQHVDQLATSFLDVMVDLETTGTGPDAAIASIGAVALDRASGQLGPTFYQMVDIVSAVGIGGKIDATTFLWWMQQSESARETFRGKEHICVVLQHFSEWIVRVAGSTEDVRVWGNGADFDPVVLGESYKRAGHPVPWKFWNVRCFRTLRNESKQIEFERIGTHHNALDDAISQAKHLLKIDAKNHAIESDHE